jgi:parvulin-like peptidyl-prolyl isomerase
MRYWQNYFMSIFFMAMLLMSCARKDKIVALISKTETISLKEFKEAFAQGKTKEDLKFVELEDMREHLNKMIEKKIIIYTAYEQNLDEDSTIISKIKFMRANELVKLLYKKEIVEPVIKETEIRDYYARQKKEVIARIIFFKHATSDKPEDEEVVRTRANEVLLKAKKGEDFADLAREFSENTTNARNGGLVDDLEWSEKVDPVVKAAFSLRVSEISDLVEDEGGYHIIKVEEIRKKPIEPYDIIWKEIHSNLSRKHRGKIREKANKYLGELKEKNRVESNDSLMKFMASKITGYKSYKRDVILDSLRLLTPEEKDSALVMLRHRKFTIRDFIKRAKESFGEELQENFGNISSLKNFIMGWIVSDLLIEKAEKKRLDCNYEVINNIEKALEKEMTRLLMSDGIIGEVDPDEEELKAFYEEKKLEKYSDPAKYEIQEIMVKDKKLAEKIYSWAKSGQDLGNLAEKYTERKGYKKKKGIIKFSAGQMGKLEDEVEKLEIDKIHKPIKLDNDNYSIIKVLNKVIPKPKPYSSIKRRLMSDLKRQLRKDKREAWLEKRKKELKVVIYENVLENAFN